MDASKKHYWRADITGLRALAVIPVLLFHAFPQIMPGGFVGVDVFFVISGYLISGILFRNLEKTGTIDFFDFYSKRIKRILPNLLMLLLAVAVFGFWVLTSDEYENLGRHIYSSSFFYQNFRLLSEAEDYFNEASVYKPLLHLWSLAIEEQFYIIFPLLLMVAWRALRSPRGVGILLLLLTLGSFAYCLLQASPSKAFYFPLSRFWELGAGILLSYAEHCRLWRTQSGSPTVVDQVLSVIGVAVIAVAFLVFDEKTPFPGWASLMPVLGAVGIMAASPGAMVNRILSARPLVFVGLISYSLYLWHWPFLSYLAITLPDSDWTANATALAASCVTAMLVYFLVENPVRRLKPVSWRLDAVLLFLLVVVWGLGQGLRLTHGLPERPVPVTVLDGIREHWPGRDGFRAVNLEGVKVYVSHTSDYPKIIFVGDSHMEQYIPRVKKVAKERNISIGILTAPGCNAMPRGLEHKGPCKNVQKFYDSLIYSSKIKRVVIFGMWGSYLVSSPDGDETVEGVDRFRYIVSENPRLSKNVFIGLDQPWGDEYDILRRIKNRFKPIDKSIFEVGYPIDDRWMRGNNSMFSQLNGKVSFIETASKVCPNQRCSLLSYKDDDHLRPSYTENNAVWIDQVFDGL